MYHNSHPSSATHVNSFLLCFSLLLWLCDWHKMDVAYEPGFDIRGKTLARHLQNRKTFSGMRSHMRNHMATIIHIHRSPCPRKTLKRTEINMSLPASAPDHTEIVLQHHNYRKVHRVNVSAVLIVLGIIHFSGSLGEGLLIQDPC